MADRRAEGAIEWRGKACAVPEHRHSRCPFRVRVATGVDPKTGRRRFIYSTGRGNARAAEAAVRDLLNKRDDGMDVQPRRVTLDEWIDRWLDGRIADGAIGPRAAENYRVIVRKRIKPALGEYRLVDLRTDHVVAFKASLVSEELAPATIGKVLGLLKQSLDAALVAGIVSRNVAQAVPRPSVTAAGARERRALSEAEVGKLLTAAAGTPYEVAIRLALATGMRQSELLGLRWADVDMARSQLAVQQTIQHVAGAFEALPPKTRNSRRVIELSPATVALLKAHRSAQNEERLRLGSVWQDHDLVLPGPDGAPQYRRIFYRDYTEIVKAARLENPEQVNWHTLRHTAASLWLKAGIDVFTVSRRLGHGRAAFTMDVYGHLIEGQQAAAASALDHLLAAN